MLKSVRPVIGESLHVTTHLPAIDSVASWMAYEEFIFPKGASAGPFDLGSSPSEIIDAVNERIDVLVPHGHVHAYVDGLAVTIDLKAKLQTPVARGPSRRIRLS